MNLVERMMEDFVIMQEAQVPDGAGGLNYIGWEDGPVIKAVAARDTTMTARVAEREGTTSVWTITTKRNVKLKYHSVLKRVRDGKIFRTTSDSGDVESPELSSLDIAQVTAEKWELTK